LISYFIIYYLSLFQNSASFEKGSGKTVQEASFSFNYKVDFPKTEVLENPNLLFCITPFFGFSSDGKTFSAKINSRCRNIYIIY